MQSATVQYELGGAGTGLLGGQKRLVLSWRGWVGASPAPLGHTAVAGQMDDQIPASLNGGMTSIRRPAD